MSKEFINPNFHVILIHYPLGLLVAGTLIELFAFLWRRSSFRVAGRWMILLGALSAAPAALSGLYAMADVNKSAEMVDRPDATWSEIRAVSPVQGHAWEMMQRHAWLNLDVTVVLLLLVVIWLGSSDLWRRRLHFPLLILLLASVAVAGISAWYGGEMIYRHGVAIQPPQSAAGAVTDAGEGGGAGAGAGAASPATVEQTEQNSPHSIEYYAPPLQVHVILAGLVIAIAAAALGLSLRAGAQQPAVTEAPAEYTDIASAFVPETIAHRHGKPGELTEYEDDPPTRRPMVYERVPLRRFWLLATVLAVLTALAGLWVLAGPDGVNSWKPNDLWDTIRDPSLNNGMRITRRLAHLLVGVSIVVLPLLLTLLGRAVAVRRIILGLFALLLVCAVAAQIWLGSLLMFDTPSGSIRAFNRPVSEAAAATMPAAPAPAKVPSPAKVPAPVPATVHATTNAAPAATTRAAP